MFAEAMAALYITLRMLSYMDKSLPWTETESEHVHPNPSPVHAHMTIWTHLVSCQLARPPFKTPGQCPHGIGDTNVFVYMIFLAKS